MREVKSGSVLKTVSLPDTSQADDTSDTAKEPEQSCVNIAKGTLSDHHSLIDRTTQVTGVD